MLPSMPLISTPYKENSRSSNPGGQEDRDEGKGQEDDDGDCRVSGSSVVGAVESVSCQAPGVSPCTKKCSPLKHVTPILKKYSCQRKVKGTKSLAGSPDQVVEKPSLRPIAPKPMVVMITSQPLAQDRNDLSITTCSLEQAPVVESSSSPMVAAEQAKSNDVEAVTEGGKNIEEHSKTEVVKDNEEDIAALMRSATNVTTSPKTRPALSRKKTKQLKDMEATLNILTEVEDAATKEEKAFSFAHSYFMKVKERLEGREEEVYQKFLQTMNEFGQMTFPVADLYQRVTDLLGHHSDLASEFLAFLLPDQALQCGKFMEHLMITKMRDFFRKLESFFAKQPHHMKKIYSSLSVLSNQVNVTIGDVQSTILPLLKGNTYLTHSFLELLPQECPPDSLMTEFEFVQCYDDSESEEELFEMVEVPDHPDPYGGNNCCCPCHDSTNVKYRTRVLHCIPCGTRFIHGRVFVETGKGLRHAKIIFSGTDAKANIERLTAAKVLQRKGRRRRRTCGHIKKNRSPSKQASAATKLASSEDNVGESLRVQSTSKISSPTLARSKTRTTNVSQKARETIESVVTANNTPPTGSPTEKKDAKNSPIKPGRQVATVRLCRVPSTVCSYAVVPSSKNNTKTSASLTETKSKATIKTSRNESSSCTTTASAPILDFSLLKPNVDQQKQQQQPLHKKSVDSFACVSDDVLVQNFDSSKLRTADCNVEMVHCVAANDLELVSSQRKKRCMNDVEFEASENQDLQVRKVAKHFRDQVVTRQMDVLYNQDYTAASFEKLNTPEMCSGNFMNVDEALELSTECIIERSREKTKESEVEGTINLHKNEEDKMICIEQARENCNGLKHEEDVEKRVKNMMIINADQKDEDTKEKCKDTVEVEVSDDGISKNFERKYQETIELVTLSNAYESEKDTKQLHEAKVEMIDEFQNEVGNCDKNLALVKLNSHYSCEESEQRFDDWEKVEMVSEYRETVDTEKSRNDVNLSEEDGSNKVMQNSPKEGLLMEISDEHRSREYLENCKVVVVMGSEQKCNDMDVTLTGTSGRYMLENDAKQSEVESVGTIKKDNHEMATQNCQGIVKTIDDHKCKQAVKIKYMGEKYKSEDDVGKCEEIEVTEMSIDENCDLNDIALVDMSEEYKCKNSAGKFEVEVVKMNSEQKCGDELTLNMSDEYTCDTDVDKEIDVKKSIQRKGNSEEAADVCDVDKCEVGIVELDSVSKCNEIALTRSDECKCEGAVNKCEEIGVVGTNIEQMYDNEIATGISDEYKCASAVHVCEEVEMEIDSEQKCDEGKSSLPNRSDSYSYEDDVEKCELESEQIFNEEDRILPDVSDENKDRNVAGKCEEIEVVEMGTCQKFEEENRKPLPWTRDEDKVILETFQMCSSMDRAFVSISHQLPSRTIQEIRTRFQTLMNLLQQMTGNSVNASNNST